MLLYPFCNLSLLVASFVALVVARFLTHIISNRVALRHVPGPISPSKLWGQEWVLYNSIPGLLYLQWHIRYGKIVKFSGALGVRHYFLYLTVPTHTPQHPILSITDPRAISFILGEGAYNFPKPHGVRAWFKALLGEGILWVEGILINICVAIDTTPTPRQGSSRRAEEDYCSSSEVRRRPRFRVSFF